ncbi:MAG: putative transposase [Candidatus Azotimanducaceae bacterium]|jgi:putative transposase
MACYVSWLHEASVKYGVKIHAWVLMTNHVHLLMTPNSDIAVSKVLQDVGRRYVRYFSGLYGRSGTLIEGRFKTSLVDTESYLLVCQRYIELNPVRAGMVADPSYYNWSSYQAHGFGKAVKMSTPHDTYLATDKDENV